MQALKLTKKYDKYTEYKDSGVEWLAKIPGEWSVVPLRSVASESKLKNADGMCQNLLSLSYGKIVRKDINSNEGLLPESFNTYQLVKRGNVVLRLTDLQNDKRSLRVGYVNSDETGIITSAYLALNIHNRLHDRYAYYLLHAYDLQKVFYGMGGGVRQALDFHDFKFLPVITPNINTQHKIAKYLDAKTSYIDQIIEKKQKLIELLMEKRSETINSAVNSVSGTTEKLKYIAPERKIKLDTAPADLRYVGLENVQSFTGKMVDSKEKAEPESSVNIFQKGDVLFGKLRPYLAKVLYADFDGVCSGEFLALVPKTEKIISKYLFYKLLSRDFIKVINDSTYGAKMPRANGQFIGNQAITYPSLDVQVKIVKALDHKMESFERVISDINKSVELLQEFKSSLVSNVVTGKVKI